MSETLTITRLGHQGDGVAGGPTFVDRALPGEVVSGRRVGNRLVDIRIETPSEHRVKPTCPHYKSCGGCQLQHASDPFVADWKQEVVRGALHTQGVTTTFRKLHISPPGSRRRATFAARRTKKGATAGFYGRASDTIADVSECRVLDPKLVSAVDLCRELAVLGASRKSALSVTVTKSETGLDLAIRNGKPLDGPLRQTLAQFAEKHGLARLCWNDEVVATRHTPTQMFGSAAVVPPPGAFLQATRDGEAALRAAVIEIVAGAKSVADLFAGCGTFSLPLAQTARVHAVEGEDEMMTALDQGWRKTQGLKQVTTETRDLFRRPLSADELAQFDGIVLDPPRAGAEAQVAEISHARCPKIAYVSCNPLSFARDARVIVDAGYGLDWIQVVDQFRWSSHIELAASFTRLN